MNCPRCKHENRGTARFCEECATPLAAVSADGAHAPSYTEVTNALREAVEQQAATSHILHVISRSPADVQQVLDMVVEHACRLASVRDAQIFRREGAVLRLVAHHGPIPTGEVGEFTMPITRGTVNGRAVMEQRSIVVSDLRAESAEFPEGSTIARQLGHRSVLTVPLMREGVAIGTLVVRRAEVLAFTDAQQALLQTFADQAVIAIENARVFGELDSRNRDLTAALDQQTATGEILGVISRSPTNYQPVFDTIVRNAGVVCGAVDAILWTVDGDELVVRAHHGPIRATIGARQSTEGSVAGRAVRESRIVHVEDLTQADDFPVGRDLARRVGWRTTLSVPLLREGVAIGAILIRRDEVRPFTDGQIALLQTFADQAVIAIENVRLFNETKESLERQTATSDILRAITHAPTDTQPVFETIAATALRLCTAKLCTVFRFDGELIHLVALHQVSTEGAAAYRDAYPAPPGRAGGTHRAILTRRIVHIPDIREDPEYELQALARANDFGSVLSVPMLRDGQPVGAITVGREAGRAFSDAQIELLKTFVSQALIAIENVRLFTELEARTQDLTRSVGELRALGEVGRAVSSTLDLETVLSTIVSRAVELSGLDGGVVFEYDEGAEEFVHRVATQAGGALAEARRSTRIRKGEGAVGQTALTLEPAQVPDITVPGAYESRLRENLIASGIRAVLAVPMVREGELIGCLVVSRNRPGEFTTDTIELLRTFATQSALAIQNARLFREIEIKSRELEAASRHKSEFLANMSHELRTPLNAIIGFSEVLSERMFGELNDKQDEYLKDIHASGQHLLSLINDILDLSKIEAGKMELELSGFDLPTTIDNALVLVRERATRRGLAVHKIVDERLGQIEADERKVRQVLLNLLSNAIKFTPEGGRIDVEARAVDGFIEVSVTDTGVGIAPEDQEAVFEEFRQVGSAEKKVEGTGLGLALSRKFIELHGGRIAVKSQVGQGSTFTFTIPVRSS